MLKNVWDVGNFQFSRGNTENIKIFVIKGIERVIKVRFDVTNDK